MAILTPMPASARRSRGSPGEFLRRLARPFAEAVAARVTDDLTPRFELLQRQTESQIAELAAALERLRTEVDQTRRLLGEQGDVAGETADLTGRILTRLSGEVDALSEELAKSRDAAFRAGAG